MLKELLKKPVLTDAEVYKLLNLMKEKYKTKYWDFVEEVLEAYLEIQQKDEYDELLEAVGLEGETFRMPKFLRVKLLKSPNSKVCGQLVDTAKIGEYVIEQREENEEGEVVCNPIYLGREVKIIPVYRIPYVSIRIEKQGNVSIHRVFPSAKESNIFAFLNRTVSQAQKLLEQFDLDDFKIKKSSLFYFIAKVNDSLKLLELNLTPVDSFKFYDFEKKLKAKTGKTGYGAIFRIGRSVVLRPVRVELNNGNIVIASSIDFEKAKLRDPESLKVILVPIVVALKNYIEKLPHEFKASTLDVPSLPASEVSDLSLNEAGGTETPEEIATKEAINSLAEDIDNLSAIDDEEDVMDTIEF